MKKIENAYDCAGNEYGIFYNEGTFELWDCFDFCHYGKHLAKGSYKWCKQVLGEILQHVVECRF